MSQIPSLPHNHDQNKIPSVDLSELESRDHRARNVSSSGGILSPSIQKHLHFIWKFSEPLNTTQATFSEWGRKKELIQKTVDLLKANKSDLNEIQLQGVDRILRSLPYSQLVNLNRRLNENTSRIAEFPFGDLRKLNRALYE